MIDLLRAVRLLLENEQALFGRYVPLGPPPPSARLGAAADEAFEPTPFRESQDDPDASMPNVDLFGNEMDPGDDPSLTPWERVESLIPDDSPIRQIGTLKELEAFARDTVLIPLDETRTKLVFGVGNPEADLMVIGEAPGADEDRQGEPFVGRAGQLLNKILEAVDLQREDVYITNILKSRPPNNRDPEPEEVEAHVPLLYKQIALIRPRIMLCVGKTAGNTLLGRRSSLGSLRDKFHDFHGVPVVVTYHPAALLRNPNWKRPTWEDMKMLRTRYDELVQAG